MSKPITKEQLDTLLFLLKDNKAALKLALDIVYVGHLWDDMIDGDKERTPDEINTAFIKAFRDIPSNIFYQAIPEPFRSQLNGLIISAAMQYRDSTKLELGNNQDRFMAFVIRNMSLSIIYYLISLVGGPDWIDEHGVLFWRTFSLREEYMDYALEVPDVF